LEQENMKLNAKQRVLLFLGIAASAFYFLFPPWNYGSVRLPYQVKWPPRTRPSIGITGYPPFSFVVIAPDFDEETQTAINIEAKKSLNEVSVGNNESVSDDKAFETLATAILGKVRIDWQRLLLTQALFVIATAALLFAFKRRRG